MRGGGTAAPVSPSPAPAGQGRRQKTGGLQINGEHQDAFYLWVLLALELLATALLRQWSRNHHGG